MGVTKAKQIARRSSPSRGGNLECEDSSPLFSTTRLYFARPDDALGIVWPGREAVRIVVQRALVHPGILSFSLYFRLGLSAVAVRVSHPCLRPSPRALPPSASSLTAATSQG